MIRMNDHRPEPRRRPLVILFGLAAGILVIDQVLKFLAVTFLEGQPPIPVIGSLAGFTFYRNPGAALGLGSGVTWIFPLIAIAVFAAILVMSRKLGSRVWAIGLGMPARRTLRQPRRPALPSARLPPRRRRRLHRPLALHLQLRRHRDLRGGGHPRHREHPRDRTRRLASAREERTKEDLHD